MLECGVVVVFVYVDEAHDSGWPAGVKNQPEPHANQADRERHAQSFAAEHIVSPVMSIMVDGWDNAMDNACGLWPDTTYQVDIATRTISWKTTYAIDVEGRADVPMLDILLSAIGTNA
jgi:hypothetical protein